MSSLVPVTSRKVMTPETIKSAAKQSSRCQVVPLRLRTAIQQYLEEQDVVHMKKKVLRLTESFNQMKDMSRLLPQTTATELVDDPFKSDQSKRWKLKSVYGDIGLTYRDDQAAAYVATRMPSVFAACVRVLREIRRRVPDFKPGKVLDFGSGAGSAFWALKEVWPQALVEINLIEPSQSMQRAGVSLVKDMKNMPLVHGYGSILSLNKDIKKTERQHDLVIASYVLGEIPSVKDRISIVRQLWALTRDMLVLIEPGTPEGSHLISQMRSHILWMEKRKSRKRKGPEAVGDGAFIVAPCPHDGTCPLVNTGKFCHFVQRMQRTDSQRAYKRSNGAPMRGFEDEKFSYVVFRRGKRPEEPWPLDGMKFDTLKEMKANRKPEDLEIDYEDQFESDMDENVDQSPSHDSLATTGKDKDEENETDDDTGRADLDENVDQPLSHDSLATTDDKDEDNETDDEYEDEEVEDDTGRADLGSGWGRIIFMPQKRGKRVELDVCRATKRDGSEGSFEHLVVTRSKNPALHNQARKSLWGDLWPF